MRNYERDENGKLSEKDREDIIRATVADLRMEGFEPTAEEIDMLRKYSDGEITAAEYDAWVLAKAGVSV